MRSKQRYKCKNCGCNFTIGDARTDYDQKKREIVVRMYLNNCGFRRIAEILEIPLTTVFDWVKKAGKIVDEMVRNRQDPETKIEILEMDELFTFVKKNRDAIKKQGKCAANTPEFGTAVDRNRLKNVAFKLGNGDKSNFVELALELESKYVITYLCTDKYKAYCYYKLAEHHIRSKSETCLVESKNSSMRDNLARLNRRTKRFSKCLEMLRLTLVMFFNKDLSYSIYA